MHTPHGSSHFSESQAFMHDAGMCSIQGVHNELAAAKEALQAGGSSSSQAQKGLVKELQSGKARLQQQVQSLQVLFPGYFLIQACNINCWIDVAQ